MASDTVTITTRPYAGLEAALEQHLADHGEPEGVHRIRCVQSYFVRGWEFSKDNYQKEVAWSAILKDFDHIAGPHTRHAFDHGWEAARL